MAAPKDTLRPTTGFPTYSPVAVAEAKTPEPTTPKPTTEPTWGGTPTVGTDKEKVEINTAFDADLARWKALKGQ